MSKTVDSRVVEMRFDNKQFETNVATSMSTIDKLKQKLNFSNSSKGLESISSAAKKVDMSNVGKGIEAVHAKFSALEVMGVTALANITNSAVNAGKKIVSALTIDPIKTGFNEYETKINAVQTIMSNTASKGTTMADVTAVLDELNTYADKTIYNFAEMTKNIGTFTAAGVGLEDSASAIQGIANLAAMSGSNSQQASTAMYQLSQALAAGTVKLMDWNSVVNAGMGGEKFQNALKETAREMGIAVDDIIEKNGSFRESLSEGWLSADVLNTTLKKLTVEGATEYANSMVKAGQYTQEQADALIEEAQAAEDAATKVKTFTQLWDTLKETAQSGWAQTWEIIIGDFESAKSILTPLSEYFGNIIQSFSDARNKLLKSALGKSFTKLSDSLKSIVSPVKNVVEGVEEVTKKVSDTTSTMKNLGNVVDNVILGKFGDGQKRIDKLTDAGENYYRVQNKVNEALGDSFRYTEEQIAAQDKLLGSQQETNKVQKETTESQKKSTEETSKLTEAQKEQLKSLVRLSDEQLKSKGYTDDQIQSLRELSDAASRLGIPIDEFIDKIDEINGRWVLLDSFKNIGKAIEQPLKLIGEAWREVFDPLTGDQVYGAIEKFHSLTESMEMSESTAENFKLTFEGLFAAFQLINGVVTMSLTTGIKILAAVLKLFGTNILEVTSNLGKIIIKFRDWVKENTIFIDGINKIAQIIKVLIDGVVRLAKAFMKLEPVQEFITKIKNAFSKFFGMFEGGIGKINFDGFIEKLSDVFVKMEKAIASLGDSEYFQKFLSIGSNIIQGLIRGLDGGISTIVSKLKEIGRAILDAIRGVLGIHSPSTEAMTIGGQVMEGLSIGLRDGAANVYSGFKAIAKNILNLFKSFFGKIMDFFSGVTISDIIVVASVVSALLLIKKALNIAEKLAKPIEGLTSILTNFAGVLKSTSRWIDAKRLEAKSNAILNFAKAIGILAAAIWVLAKIPIADLVKATAAIVVLAGVITALTFAAAKAGKVGDVSFGKLAALVLSLSIALILLSVAMKILSTIDCESGRTALIELGVLIVALGAVAVAFGRFAQADVAGSMNKAAKMFTKMAVAMLILAVVMKIMSGISNGDIVRSGAVMIGMLSLFTIMMALSQFAGQNAAKAGAMFLLMSVAMGILVRVIKSITEISDGDLKRGGKVITQVAALFALVMGASLFAGKNATKAGVMFLLMSVAIGILVRTIKTIAEIPDESIDKAKSVITRILIVFGLVMAASALAGQNAAKAGAMFLMMGAAIGILALSIKLLASISEEDMTRGYVAILTIMTMFTVIANLTKNVGKNAASAGKMMLTMSVAILVLVGAIALLSILDPADVVRGMVCVTGLLGMFALIMKASESISTSYKSILMMAICIGLIAGAVVALSFLDQSKVITASACLTVLLGMFALVMKASGSITSSVAPILAMSVAIGLLSVCLYVVGQLPAEQALAAAVSLSLVLIALAAAIKILATIQTVSPMAIVALGAMVVVIGLLGVILGLLQYFNVQPSLETVAALSLLLISMSAACILLAAVGLLAPEALIGAAALSGVIAILGTLMVAIGALMQYVPSLEQFLDKGITILAKIGEGLGLFIGSIVGGVIEGASSSLPALGTNLGLFMEGAKPFFDGLSGLDSSVAESAGALAKAILLITASGIVDSVASFFGIDGMEQFGTKLTQLGEGMKSYGDAVAGVDTAAISASAEAALALVKVANAVPPEGGVLQNITGQKDLGSFGAKLVLFGLGMKMYGLAVAGLDTASITASATAAKALVKVADAIPPEGGIVQAIMGQKDLGSFGEKLELFGEGMKNYGDSVVGIDCGAISASAKAAQALVKVANAIPEEGGIIQVITGQSDLKSFGEKLKDFGDALSDYSDSVSGLDSGSIISSSNVLSRLVRLLTTIQEANIDFGDVKSFVKSANKLNDIDVGEINVADGVKSSVSDLKKAMTSIVTTISSKKSAITSAMKGAMSGATSAVKSSTSSIKTAMTQTLTQLVTTIRNKKATVTSAFKTLVSGAASAVRSSRGSFISAGGDLANGLILGIRFKILSAYSAGYALGAAAAQGEKDGQKSKSPSKLTIQAGKWLGEGLIIGIESMGKSVYNTGYSMGETATRSISGALSKVGDLVDSDMDVQPTISPVMDLSDVENGVGAINGMFGQNFGLGASANISAISSMMNRRGQNGANDDVVSAIKDLTKSFGSSGDTYNLNGITYDDGSNIVDAVKTIVREAKVERRA